MPQLSRKFLDKATQERILSLFISSIVLSQTKEMAVRLVEDLFTPTEKVMLAKRFSIAFLLLEGYDYRTIASVLKVSTGTVGRVAAWLKSKGQGIKDIKEKIKQHESLNKLWNDLKEGVAEAFLMSPGMNWKTSRKIIRRIKEANQKPF